MGCSDGDGVQDDGGAVGDGEFVVAGGQAAPLLDGVESALDHVAPLVIGGVEGRWAPSAGAASFTVRYLI